MTVTQWHSGGEHARDFCSACDLLNSAENHRNQAAQMRLKANAIIAARRK